MESRRHASLRLSGSKCVKLAAQLLASALPRERVRSMTQSSHPHAMSPLPSGSDAKQPALITWSADLSEMVSSLPTGRGQCALSNGASSHSFECGQNLALAQLALDVVELADICRARYWRGHSSQAVHRRWLATVRPITLAQQIVLQDYIDDVVDAEQRGCPIDGADQKSDWSIAPAVTAIRAMCGVAFGLAT
jgi:hypothetical protein